MEFDEKLIKAVKKRRGLYDDNIWNSYEIEHRVKLWKEVSVEVDAGIDVCVTRFLKILSGKEKWKYMNNEANIYFKPPVSILENTSLVIPTNLSSNMVPVFKVTYTSPRIETLSAKPVEVYFKPPAYGDENTLINTKTSSTFKPTISVVPITSLVEPSHSKPSFSAVESTTLVKPRNLTKSSVLAVTNSSFRTKTLSVKPNNTYSKPLVFGVENASHRTKTTLVEINNLPPKFPVSNSVKKPSNRTQNLLDNAANIYLKPPVSVVETTSLVKPTKSPVLTVTNTSFRSKTTSVKSTCIYSKPLVCGVQNTSHRTKTPLLEITNRPSKFQVSSLKKPSNRTQTLLDNAAKIYLKPPGSVVENTSFRSNIYSNPRVYGVKSTLRRTKTSLVGPTNLSSNSSVSAVKNISNRRRTIKVNPAIMYSSKVPYQLYDPTLLELVEPTNLSNKSPVEAVPNTLSNTKTSLDRPRDRPTKLYPKTSSTFKSSVSAIPNTSKRSSSFDSKLSPVSASTVQNCSTKTTSLVVEPPSVSPAENTNTTTGAEASTLFHSHQSQTNKANKRKKIMI